MKIGIDLDGVVIDSENTWRVYEEIFDVKEVGGNNLIRKEEPYFQQRYNWSQSMQDTFWDEYIFNAAKEANLMPGFKYVYELLKKEKHQFIVITARGGRIPELIDEAIEKFEKNDINFDKYYWNVHDKALICKNENIDVMIDDNWKNCLDISNVKVKTLYFRAANLKKLQENDYIKEVNNWGEIYRYIKELKK